MDQLPHDLMVALYAARAGARVVYENFGHSGYCRVKGNERGLVTGTDLAAEKAIVQVLKNESEYAILSEEGGNLHDCSGPKWIIDPLDGTNNFARGIPLFAVSVGLMEGNRPLAGAIIDPVNKTEYFAATGTGMHCNGRKIQVPAADHSYIPMVFLNHGYPESDRYKFALAAKRLAIEYNILKLGSTALELCYVASGKVDGFICSGDELWDFAAGVVLAQEAGCKFTDWKGDRWNGLDSHILIARPEIHDDILKKLGGLGG